jgi:hypothetical protein
MTANTTYQASLQERFAPFISRGSALAIPEGAEVHYTEPTRNLMTELTALAKDRTTAQAEVRDCAAKLAAAPAEFQTAAARAARAGETLPKDPIAGLERERGEAQRRVEALDAAVRAVGRELVSGLDTESVAASEAAYEAAGKDLAAAIRAVHRAVEATEKAERLWGLSQWAAAPTGGGQLPTLGTAVADLRKAGRTLRRVASSG